MGESFDTSRPIYIQITEQLTRKIIAGEYPIGTRLTPVRELAIDFGVNPNTMQRALAELERQGLLYTNRTAGRFVTDNAQTIRAMQNELAGQMVNDFVQQMAQMGYTKAQVVQLLQQTPSDTKVSSQPQSTAKADSTECAAPLQDATHQGGTIDE